MQIFELINLLKQLPHNAKIYLSSDSEGNSYGTISNDSFEINKSKNYIIIYPYLEGLNFEDL